MNHHLYSDLDHLHQFHNLEIECNHHSFFANITTNQQCDIAKNNCEDSFDFINFFFVQYCLLEGNIYLSVSLSIFLIFLIFRFISSVVEQFLAPSITYLSEWFQLPEALAAVTLLALANGAGDVITALVASGTTGGLAYNIGAIYGAGLFVCSIVVAMTILNSAEDIQLEPSSIWRDVGIYIIATISVLIFGFIGKLEVYSAIIMLFEYLLLVVIVWCQGQNNEVQDDPEDQKNKSKEINKNEILNKGLIYFPDDKTDEEKQARSKKWAVILSKFHNSSGTKKSQLIMKHFKTIIYQAKALLKKEKEETIFSEMSIFDKFFFIIDIPFDYLRKITLPPCDRENYSKKFAMIFPIPGILLILFSTSRVPQVWWLYTVPLGVICSLIIYFTSENDKPPKYYVLMEFFGTIGSLLWTYLVSGMLIDLLQFLGMLSKLNQTFLGLTVIAVGNALPDAVTTIALAKQGYAMMGMTGAYGIVYFHFIILAGQLFGLLVGFGLALLKKTLQEGPQEFDIFDPTHYKENLMNAIVILISLLNLTITFFYGLITKYKFKRSLAYIIGVLYLLFVIGSSMIAIYKALKQ